jgi:hypothetical protein
MNNIINIPQIDVEKLKKEWKFNVSEATAVVEMTNTEGWNIVKKELTRMLDDTFKNVVIKMNDWSDMKDSILIAKAIQKILSTVDSYAGRAIVNQTRLKQIKNMENKE